MSTIAFIGDDNTAYALAGCVAFNPNWGAQVRAHKSVTEFLENDYQPDVMVLTDVTADDSRDILNLLAGMVVERIPTAIIAFHDGTPAMVNAGWDRLKAWTKQQNEERVQSLRGRGEEVPDYMLTNPAETTDVFIAPRALGIRGLLEQLAEPLGLPLEEVQSLPGIMAAPIPEPSAGNALTVKTSEGGDLFAFTSDKGGCGKTSSAVMFGAAIAYHSALAGKPKNVVIVDADRQSQMRSHFRDVDARKNITALKGNATPEDVRATVVQFQTSAGGEYPGLYALLGGDNNSNEHLAFRDVDLYSHLIPILRRLFDVVIVDCSVGVLKDEVTAWVVQHATRTYYVLDRSKESFDMAVAVRDGATQSAETGGLGVNRDAFRVLINRARTHGHDPMKEEWAALVHNNFTVVGTTIEGEIPDSHPEVSDAKELYALPELVQTSDMLAGPLQLLAHRAYPTVIAKSGIPGQKKKGLLGRG